MPREDFSDEAPARVHAFIREGRENLELAAFIALVDGAAVGSATCQLRQPPYPEVLRPGIRRFGYIWTVFVAEGFRGRGIARSLVEQALGHLRAIGCTVAVLHASDAGEPLYAKLGFRTAKEMRLPFDGGSIE